jgi:hypothetical protein
MHRLFFGRRVLYSSEACLYFEVSELKVAETGASIGPLYVNLCTGLASKRQGGDMYGVPRYSHLLPDDLRFTLSVEHKYTPRFQFVFLFLLFIFASSLSFLPLAVIASARHVPNNMDSETRSQATTRSAVPDVKI